VIRIVMPDVTIIGAGPAGATAAFALATRGWDVTLIEQQRFPRDKVCGESLSALGLEVLTRLGLVDRLRLLKPTVLGSTVLHSADGRHLTCRLPRPMWGLSRLAMDAALLDAARNTGVRVLQPARCESLSPATIRHPSDNRVETLHPSWIILADGKGALLPDRPRATSDFGIKAHFDNVTGPRDAVELFGVQGHYIGLAPIEGGRSNIAFSVPVNKLEHSRGNLDALWTQLLSENTALAQRFTHATRSGDWLASPLPRFPVSRRWPPRIIPLGNSAAALEPIGGEGMGLAMRSAELAAEALDQSHRANTPLPVRRLQTQFGKLWRTRQLACRALARLLSAPSIAGDVIDLARGNEPLSRVAMAMIGKG
jgi:2-polyprenyl-6-methoxyphenol hydroxylase-like FAD-dependent oxidoreductase